MNVNMVKIGTILYSNSKEFFIFKSHTYKEHSESERKKIVKISIKHGNEWSLNLKRNKTSGNTIQYNRPKFKYKT